MCWLLVLFPEGIYCLLRWAQISACIPIMDRSPATYWSYAADVLAFSTWEGPPTPIPPWWMRMSIFFYPSSVVWSSQAVARCLGESCNAVLCSLNTLYCTTGHNWSARKMKESVGLLKDTGDLVTEDMGKIQLLYAFFALVHWWSLLSGLLNTCGWWQCFGRVRLCPWQKKITIWISSVDWACKKLCNQLAPDAPEREGQFYSGGPF